MAFGPSIKNLEEILLEQAILKTLVFFFVFIIICNAVLGPHNAFNFGSWLVMEMTKK